MLTFFTDPHLGRNAASHTTPVSRKKLDIALYETAKTAATLYGDPTICCGDLFHKAHNPEAIIKQGIDIALECNLILEGNHDLPNRADAVPSMRLVPYSIGGNNYVASCDVGEVRAYVENIDGVQVGAIPHHSSQALFEEAIDSACSIGGDIICLHANFESPYTEGVNTSLNLTRELADKLLTAFDFIVMGHEHMHRWEMDGRLLILGNTHPTSFSDISDKYAWRYDKSKKKWYPCQLWSKEYYYAKIRVEDLLESVNEVEIPPMVQFIEVVGKVYNSEETHTLAQRMNEIWRLHSDSLLMLRNSAEVVAIASESPDMSGVMNTETLKAHLAEMVKGTELEKAFKKYAGADYD